MELKENMVLLDQAPATKKEAIRLAGELLVKEGCVDERYIDSMIKRNEDVSTYMGNLHCYPDTFSNIEPCILQSSFECVVHISMAGHLSAKT